MFELVKGRYQLEGPDHTEKVCSFESLDELVNHYKSYGLVDRSMTLIKFSIPGKKFLDL